MSYELDLSNLNEQQRAFYDYVAKPRKMKTLEEDLFDDEDRETYEFLKFMYYDFNTGIPFEHYYAKMKEYLRIIGNLRYNRYCPNPEQLVAIMLNALRIRISAGAGAGKTVTLENALLMKQSIFHINEHEILACTYTDGGAQNMIDRYRSIRKEMDSQYDISFSTIHSYCNSVIKSLGAFKTISDKSPAIEHIYNEETGDYDVVEVTLEEIIRPCINTYAPDSHLSTSRVLSAISYIAESGISTEEEFKMNEKFQDFPTTLTTLNQIRDAYDNVKAERGLVDYTDMLTITLDYLRSLEVLDINSPEMNDLTYRYLRKRLICIDECQDTTPLQVSIINELLRLNPDCALIVIGDADQAIFSFTGGDVGFIINFIKDRLNEGVCASYITENRRSSPPIVELGTKFVAQNKFRIPTVMSAMKHDLEGHIETIEPPKGSNKDLIFLTHTMNVIKEQIASGKKYDDIAILYREHRQAIPYMLEMIKQRIPVNCLQSEKNGGVIYPCYLKPVKDVLSVIRWLYQPKNEWHIRKALSLVVPNLKQFIVEDLIVKMKQDPNTKILSILNKNPNFSGAVKILAEIFSDLKRGEDCDIVIPQILSLYKKATIDWQLTNKNKTDTYKKNLLATFEYAEQYFQLYQNMNISQMMVEHDNTCEWVNKHCNISAGVIFRTYYAAKGNEYDTVILLPISDEVSPKPSMIANYSEANKAKTIEVERRALYVAVTRAIRNLYIYYGDNDGMFVKEFKKFIPRGRIDYIPENKDEGVI